MGWGSWPQLHVVMKQSLKQCVFMGPAWSDPYQPFQRLSAASRFFSKSA